VNGGPAHGVCTYCAGPKREDEGLLPAVERYRSRRIRLLALRAAWERRPFLILSGEYGLLGPDEPIPWYDHLLLEAEVEAMVPPVVRQLQGLRLEALDYHTAPLMSEPRVKPYFDLISAACARAGVALDIHLLPAGLD